MPEDRLRGAVIEWLMCDLAVDLDAVVATHQLLDFDFALERAALEALLKWEIEKWTPLLKDVPAANQ